MPKVMLFTNSLQDFPAGGRELLCKMNHDLLKDIFGDEFKIISCYIIIHVAHIK